MQSTFKMDHNLRGARLWLGLFAAGLFLSGVTAIPLEKELGILRRLFPAGNWLSLIAQALSDTNHRYPFLSYGTDWLAFAHFVLAFLFIGPLRDPLRNKWVVEFGMIACILVIPYAMIAGHFRGIPFWWRLVDCSFGLAGLIPLSIVLGKINRIEKQIQQKG
jgi:hypothetical protein